MGHGHADNLLSGTDSEISLWIMISFQFLSIWREKNP